MRSAKIMAITCSLLGALSGLAHASSVPEMDIDELLDLSNAVVVGTCRSAETIWVGRNLVTRYRIEIDETLLGEKKEEVFVVVPGGVDMDRKHPIAVVVPGAPMMSRNEEVVLLLKAGGGVQPGDMSIVGFNQGRLPIAASSASSPSATLTRSMSPRETLRQKLRAITGSDAVRSSTSVDTRGRLGGKQ